VVVVVAASLAVVDWHPSRLVGIAVVGGLQNLLGYFVQKIGH
jgi:hypothetical protein